MTMLLIIKYALLITDVQCKFWLQCLDQYFNEVHLSKDVNIYA